MIMVGGGRSRREVATIIFLRLYNAEFLSICLDINHSSFKFQVYQEKENASSPAPDALLVVMGKVREDPIRIQSVDFL